MRSSGLNCCQGICRRHLGIIMGMNTYRNRSGFPYRSYRFCYFTRQRTSISVAQDKTLRPCFGSSFKSTQSISTVGFKAIKKMLGVKENGKPFCLEMPYGISYHFKVFFRSGFQYMRNLQFRAFTHNGYCLNSGVFQNQEVNISLRIALGPAGAAKSHYFRISQFQVPGFFEKFRILGIGTGVATLNIVDTQFIKLPGNMQFIHQRERNAFALCSVTQGSIIKLY